MTAETQDIWDDPTVGDDEKHIAAAMYLLTKAIALREEPHGGWPAIHACLRDAAAHCEQARQRWTKERMEEIERVGKEVFALP